MIGKQAQLFITVVAVVVLKSLPLQVMVAPDRAAVAQVAPEMLYVVVAEMEMITIIPMPLLELMD